jgi:hypothetical protein
LSLTKPVTRPLPVDLCEIAFPCNARLPDEPTRVVDTTIPAALVAALGAITAAIITAAFCHSNNDRSGWNASRKNAA